MLELIAKSSQVRELKGGVEEFENFHKETEIVVGLWNVKGKKENEKLSL
jgi:hypothetical protein